MKDEIAEKSAEECAKLDPYKFTTRQYVESLSTIIAEACRKARVEELSNLREQTQIVLNRLSTLTPKETKV